MTEAEVVEACRRSLPVDSTQAIRKRTRAGMGGCQGKPWNYGCECRVAQIIAREQKLSTDLVGRRPWKATSQFERRWLTPADKQVLATCAEGSYDYYYPEGGEDEAEEGADEAALLEKIEGALPLKLSEKESEKEETA